MSDINQSTSLVTVREAFNKGAHKAEFELQVIGKDHGDEALALITKELSPAEIFSLAKEGDLTKSSVTAAFVTPDQLRQAFSYFGSRYGGDITSRVLVRDLVDFLHPFFTEGSLERRHEMIRGFLEHRLGLKTFCCIGILDTDFVEFFAKDGMLDSDRGWKDLLILMKAAAPRRFEKIRGWVREEFPDGYDEKKASKILGKFAAEIVAEAQTIVGESGEGPNKTDEVFKDI